MLIETLGVKRASAVLRDHWENEICNPASPKVTNSKLRAFHPLPISPSPPAHPNAAEKLELLSRSWWNRERSCRAGGRDLTVAVPEACGASQTLTANPDTLDGMGANDRPGLRPTSDREHPSCPAVAFSRRS